MRAGLADQSPTIPFQDLDHLLYLHELRLRTPCDGLPVLTARPPPGRTPAQLSSEVGNSWSAVNYVSVSIESAVDELIATASRLNESQLLQLARATRRAMGRGPAAYLGLASPSAALQAATTVGKKAGRESLMEEKGPQLNEAVLSAAIGSASLAGRETAEVQGAWDEYKVAVDSGQHRHQKRAFRASRGAFRRGLGRPLDRRWLIASVGANWALVALVTWDLAENAGRYTLEHRHELTIPWTAVAPVPDPDR